MARVANPFDLVGLELSVIAAVVLGGARLAGGYGTLTGTLLGVALIVAGAQLADRARHPLDLAVGGDRRSSS